MAIEDQDQASIEDASESELADALDCLRRIPQAAAAKALGISDRRYRDIERGYSRPRNRTRAAILKLANDIQAGDRFPSNEADFESGRVAEYAGLADGSFPWGGVVVFGFLLVWFIGAVIAARNPQSSVSPLAPNEE